MARRSRLLAGAVWGGIVSTVVLLSLWPERGASQAPGSDWSAGHLPAYAVVTWASIALFQSRGAHPRTARRAGAATAATLGAAMEGLQPMFGRGASLVDVAWNLGGVALGLVAWRALQDHREE